MDRKLTYWILLAVVLIVGSCGEKHESQPKTETAVYKVVGVIKAIDFEGLKITIDHEDIPGYMPAMEMTEKVPNREAIVDLKPGDKVQFEILRNGSELSFTSFVKVGVVSLSPAAELYKVNCAECHGANGEGTDKGISLVKGHALHHTEAEHIKQVTFGEGDKMPAFEDKLSKEEIKAVVKFVREVIQKDPKRDDSRKHKH